jgi:hypothetical protein
MIKYWFEAEGEESGIEMIFPCDPEFTLQALKFTTMIPKVTKNIVSPPSYFHTKTHGLECIRKQMVIHMLLMMFLERKIKFKPSVNNGLYQTILNLVSDETRNNAYYGTGAANTDVEFTDDDYGLNDEDSDDDKENNDNNTYDDNDHELRGGDVYEEPLDDENNNLSSTVDYNEEMESLLEKSIDNKFENSEKKLY